MEMLYTVRAWVAWCALAAMAMTFVVALTWPQIRIAYARANPAARCVFLVSVALMTLYGGSKGTGRIVYPTTDPEVRYLLDNGSYVTNDAVRVAFTRNVLVPSTANFYLDRCEIKYTNEAEIVAHIVNAYSNTFDRMTVPFDFAFAAATNHNWYAYTDWTPSPIVHTNGVAIVNWLIGGKTNHLALVRTGIYTNAAKAVAHTEN